MAPAVARDGSEPLFSASNAEISKLLGTCEATVRSHLKNMRDKLCVSRPEGLLLAAVGLDMAGGVPVKQS